MSGSEFVVWAQASIPNAASLLGIAGVPKHWELKQGVSRAEGWPDDASFAMDPDFPHDLVLIDSMNNISQLIVASRRLKECLEIRRVESVEYLPVKILDHRGRVASSDYFIVHAVGLVPCVDPVTSGLVWRDEAKGRVDSMERMAIVADRVPPSRSFFRPTAGRDAVIVRRTLSNVLDSEGFVGIRWVDPLSFRI